MATYYERNPSLWVATTGEYSASPYPGGELSVDVAVLGGGITGLLTAYSLAQEGARVAVIEARRIAGAATGYTTAKVTVLHGLTYASLIEGRGEEDARRYAEANQAAVRRITSLVRNANIDCDFRPMPAYTFTERPELVADIEAEVAACNRLGLPATYETDCDLPFAIQAAVKLDGQALFHPRKFCLALAGFLARDGHHVFETTRALDVQEGSPCDVTTDRGHIRAANVVVATQLPFLARGQFHAKTKPSRSYALAVSAGRVPDGMYLNVEAPTRSIRPHPTPEKTYLLVGGEGHAVGEDRDTTRRYAALEAWAAERFDLQSVDYRWSAQDYMPVDHAPFIGPIDTDSHRLYVATGFLKWGMTHAMVAATIITDLIAGRRNDWLPAFDARRGVDTESPVQTARANLEAARQLAGDKLPNTFAPGVETLAPGEAGIVEVNGESVAAYRDEAGTLHQVKAACTHMGCDVRWNTAETTWDCPCHGSRFTYEGAVIQGPALEDLGAL
jgi:glycine/D-amino acid oxidase-like deaminating enzyme/nitrite reductase/ring-hydroxylating ferredoxin subunit